MNPNEAKEQLHLIQQAQAIEKSVGRPEVGWFLIIWGIVWFVGFLLSQYAPSAWLLPTWIGLMFIGSISSGIVGMRLGQQVQYTRTGPKLGWFYTATIGFAIVWLFLAQPTSWLQAAVLAISFLGFSIVTSGILLKNQALIVIGISATLFAIVVYLVLPAQFGLLMGLVGGGGMILAGFRFMRSARG